VQSQALQVHDIKPAKQFTSWVCLCPGTKITGGKLMSDKISHVLRALSQRAAKPGMQMFPIARAS
jgi:hypothetical protein